MIQITINREAHEFSRGDSLQTILEQVKVKSNQGIAVAVNDQVIPKSIWEKHTIKEADKITIIKATQGG